MKKTSAIIDAMQKYMDGHINETVERHNFCHRFQQSGESFDEYLVSLRELAKTCKFCSDACMQKNIRDQIIEGLYDGNTVESLLQEAELTLATTSTKCRSKEAAQKNQSDRGVGARDRSHISTSLPTTTTTTGKTPTYVRDVEERSIRGDGFTVQPMTNHVLSLPQGWPFCESLQKQTEVPPADTDQRHPNPSALQPMLYACDHNKEITYNYTT